jgi:hypothetical protein
VGKGWGGFLYGGWVENVGGWNCGALVDFWFGGGWGSKFLLVGHQQKGVGNVKLRWGDGMFWGFKFWVDWDVGLIFCDAKMDV